jgi:hypothetical protein
MAATYENDIIAWARGLANLLRSGKLSVDKNGGQRTRMPYNRTLK